LWAVPRSELDRTVGLVAEGALGRPANLPAIGLTWAPLVEHDDASAALLRRAATYAVLNKPSRGCASVGESALRWWRTSGSSSSPATRLRPREAIPLSVIDDLTTDADPAVAGAVAARIGATSIALPATDAATVADRVAWARRVLEVVSAASPPPD